MGSKEIKADRGGFSYDGSGIGNSPTFNITNARKYGSLLNPLLEKIINVYNPDIEIITDYNLPDPEEKLAFNKVKVFTEDIIECTSFLSLVEEQVDAIDDESPGAKKKFLRAILQNYKNHRSQLLIKENISIKDKDSMIYAIRNNSDYLIKQVSETILEHACVDLYSCPIEDVRDSISLIVCYGFINCNILEKPNDYL